MRHDLTIEGFAYRLRPIDDSDAPFVVMLRRNPELAVFLHSTSPDIADQVAWFALYYERPGDYYFVVERRDTGVSEGLVSLYDIDPQTACGEWGRWILKTGSLAAIESAWLIYRCAFERLKLKKVFCRTAAENIAVVSFHDSCGISERKFLSGHFHLNGKLVDAIEHTIDVKTWGSIRPRLEKLAQLTARRLAHA
jgi:RimJ/RimL family protein N-acetyltransferase